MNFYFSNSHCKCLGLHCLMPMDSYSISLSQHWFPLGVIHKSHVWPVANNGNTERKKPERWQLMVANAFQPGGSSIANCGSFESRSCSFVGVGWACPTCETEVTERRSNYEPARNGPVGSSVVPCLSTHKGIKHSCVRPFSQLTTHWYGRRAIPPQSPRRYQVPSPHYWKSKCRQDLDSAKSLRYHRESRDLQAWSTGKARAGTIFFLAAILISSSSQVQLEASQEVGQAYSCR
jgi:hypothetical protein